MASSFFGVLQNGVLQNGAHLAFLQVARSGSLASCRLNRPSRLNALTLDMVRELRQLYRSCAADPSCCVLVLRGAGDKAFCAGGDMRALAEDALAGGSLARDFFREEYALNAHIARFECTQVSVWDGIVMGGGAGLSVHGKFRVATERTVFAMPECAIGFFPDVGASHFLNALGPGAGAYLALTGVRVGAADACELGLATHFLPSGRAAELDEALAGCVTPEDVDTCLRQLGADAHPPPPATGGGIRSHMQAIERCFAQPTVGAIVAALELERSEWAAQGLQALRKQCPSSLVITLHLLQQGAGRPLGECLSREYELAARLTAPPAAGERPGDFFEGVRAVLIDKDQRPAWHPRALEALDPSSVISRYFGGDGPKADLDLVGPESGSAYDAQPRSQL